MLEQPKTIHKPLMNVCDCPEWMQNNKKILSWKHF